jgi:hypothetical protein
MDSALNLTVERARPIPLPLTSGKAWEETANRRADDRGRAINLREDDFSGRPLGQQATLNRIAATGKNVRGLKRRPAEPKQRRAVSQQPQLERAAPLSWPDKTPSDSLDFAPVGKT